MGWWANPLEFLVAVGFFELLREGASRFWNRNRAKIDAAQLIQQASLALIEPLEHRLEDANRQVEQLTTNVRHLEDEIALYVQWSRQVLTLLDQHNLTAPHPMPTPIRH